MNSNFQIQGFSTVPGKSWWREFDENSGDVLDILESVTAGNEENAIKELIEMKVLR